MDTLPTPAPDHPLTLAERWLAEAEARAVKNPWAMALASVSTKGRPSVRYVLLKSLESAEACIVFYTNYDSRKAGELESTGFGACALYWPEMGRQLRFEGRVERSPAAESDAYFDSRPRESQLNAWASEQSRPLGAPSALSARRDDFSRRFPPDSAVPRPKHWGGYRLYFDAIEFWLEGADRFHERLRYTLEPDGRWSSALLQP